MSHRSQISTPRLVVALFLVKSKPNDCSVRGNDNHLIDWVEDKKAGSLSQTDYLDNLRSSIRPGFRSSDISKTHRHVDTADFWEKAFRRAEEEKSELRAKIFKLEWQIDKGIQEQTNTSSTSQAQCTGKTSKPGQGSNDIAKSSCSDQIPDTLPNTRTLSETFEALANARPYIYAIHRGLSKNPPAPTEVASNICQLLSKLRQSLFVGQTSVIPENDVPDNRSKRKGAKSQRQPAAEVAKAAADPGSPEISVAELIFPHILKVVRRLGEIAVGDLLHSQIVYHIIALLRDIFEHICLLSATRGRGKYNQSLKLMKSRSTRSRCLETNQHETKLTPDDQILSWCRLLISLIATLDSKRQADQDILDGFLYFVLTKVGEMMKSFVFGLEGNESLTEGLDPVFNQGIPSSNTVSESTDAVRAISESQVPYVVWILENAMATATQPFGVPKTPSSQGRIRQGILSEKAKMKFQHTLLKSIFGSQAEELADSIQQPRNPSVDLGSVSMAPQPGIVDWFKAEVWRIVGWDFLKDSIWFD
ncbi:MAG: hypothetical protein Q9167_005571 [Letrouitia subvulpina]